VGGRGDCRLGHQHRSGRGVWHFGDLEARHQADAVSLELSCGCCLATIVLVGKAHSMRGIHKVTCFELRRTRTHDLRCFLTEESCLVDEGTSLEGTGRISANTGVCMLPSIVVVIHASCYRLWRFSSLVRRLWFGLIIAIGQVTILTSPCDHCA
jgi:hypothetical protein